MLIEIDGGDKELVSVEMEKLRKFFGVVLRLIKVKKEGRTCIIRSAFFDAIFQNCDK